MRKRDTSDSESENASGNSSSEEEAAAETVANGKSQEGMSEYEKQRLSRIAENRARLEALGLPKMASSLKGVAQNIRNKKKGKGKVEEDDEEYRPDEGEARSGSSSGDDGHDEDDGFTSEKASGSRKRKVKNKGSKLKVSGQKHCSNSECIDDDEALRQAIALSLKDSAGGSYCSEKHLGSITKDKKKGSIHIQEDKGRKKNKQSFSSRLQMTEDEIIVHFFQLDEAGKGTVMIRDLQRVALAHDFLWTDKELIDMIHYFDSDGDGKLSLEDFRNIVVRCNMIKGA